MSLQKEIKKELLEKFSEKYDLKNKNIIITIQDKPPQPDELAKNGAILESVGRIKDRFVYAVKKRNWESIEFICTIYTIVDIAVSTLLFIPKGYDFIQKTSNQIFDGHYDVVQNQPQKEDGYLVIRQGWVNDPVSFKKDNSDYLKGDYGSLYYPDAAYIPASSSSGSVSNGTYSLTKS